MPNIKLLIKLFDWMIVSIWGLTLVDLSGIAIKSNLMLDIDSSLKTFMAVVGSLYFVIQIPHRIRTQRIEREIKKEELEKLKRENETSN